MKKTGKIILATITCLLAAQLFFSYPTVYDTPHGDFVKDTGEIEFPAASLSKSETDKYILRYNPETSGVILITKKSDGSEILSSVDEVNTFFLTDEDIKNLTEGIEVSTKEELFILIEDLSS